jgi:hypothetical protein
MKGWICDGVKLKKGWMYRSTLTGNVVVITDVVFNENSGRWRVVYLNNSTNLPGYCSAVFFVTHFKRLKKSH